MIGIYSITNSNNGKQYIGKSVNITSRWYAHRQAMKSPVHPKKRINKHLWYAAQKHGLESFVFKVLESFEEVNPSLLADRELFWIEYYKTHDRKNGYNLRRDSSSLSIVHPETIAKHRQNGLWINNPNFGNRWSEEQKESMRQNRLMRSDRYGDEWREKISSASKVMWQDKDKLHRMAQKVRESLLKYDFIQMDRAGNVIRVWSDIRTILLENPDFKKQCIYAVCDGYKNTYKNFRWRKTLKKELLDR